MKKTAHGKFVYVFILSSLCLTTINSCNDNTVSNNNENYNLITSISGVISGLPDSARLVKAIVQLEFLNYTLDSNIADSNNAMILNLRPPGAGFLFDVDGFFFSDTITSVTISDHDAKINLLITYAFYDSSGDAAGELLKDNRLSFNQNTAGYFLIVPTYSDRKLKITGSTTIIYNKDTVVLSYNVNMGEGWNVLTSRIKTLRSNFRESELFNGEPAGANWYFRNINSVLSRKSINGFKSFLYTKY